MTALNERLSKLEHECVNKWKERHTMGPRVFDMIATERHTSPPSPLLCNYPTDQSFVMLVGTVSLFRDKRATGQSPDPQFLPRSALVAIIVPAYIAVCELLVRLEPFKDLVRDCIRVLVDADHTLVCVLDCITQEVADRLQAVCLTPHPMFAVSVSEAQELSTL